MSFWFDFSEARCVYTLPLKSILCKSKVGECLKGHCWFKLIFSDNAFWILYHETALFIQIYFFSPCISLADLQFAAETFASHQRYFTTLFSWSTLCCLLSLEGQGCCPCLLLLYTGWSGQVAVHEQSTASTDEPQRACKNETSDLQSALKPNKQKSWWCFKLTFLNDLAFVC